MDHLLGEIRSCIVCSEHLEAGPRSVVQAGTNARIVIIGIHAQKKYITNRKNTLTETETLPAVQQRIAEVLHGPATAPRDAAKQ